MALALAPGDPPAAASAAAPPAETQTATAEPATTSVEARYGVHVPPAGQGRPSTTATSATPIATPAQDGGWRLNPPDRWYALKARASASPCRSATPPSTSPPATASNRNIGVVPLLKVRERWTPKRGQGFWLGAEIDGAYIRGKVISGTRDDFEGALLDASLRAGFKVPRAGDVFVNIRYVGGGARGTASTPRPGKDGYAENWLHTMALSLGLYIR